MNTIKITVTLSSMSVAWAYKAKNSRDFWEDLHQSLATSLGENLFSHRRESSVSHSFEFVVTCSADTCEQAINRALDTLLPDQNARDSVTVCVHPSADNTPIVKEITTDTEPSITQPSMETIPSEKPSLVIESLSPTPKSEKVKTDKEAVTLLTQAQKLDSMKNGLLDKVKGQRHAVDEVVQTIFECEMFASHDPDRVTPLATFLFTGPSGVGKTFLANQCKKHLDREILVVDMTEYSDNLANGKFNGDHGQANVVTGFIRKHPNGIIVFDEIEKAHINTIHLFLQILDAGRLMDFKIKQEVSFRDAIIIMTTNAGKDLYDDPNVFDLSGTPRNVILEALRKDVNPQTNEPYFPECITTRMANGHVILFNHLEPYALMEIIGIELDKQIRLFESASGVKVEYDKNMLSALVLYHGGGAADARSLRGLAKNIVVRELQEVVMQVYRNDPKAVDNLKTITIRLDVKGDEVTALFSGREDMHVAVMADCCADVFARVGQAHNTTFDVFTDADLFKRRVYAMTDYVLIDPLCGRLDGEQLPNDIEDIASLGMEMFDYIREFSPETPVYILDSSAGAIRSFDTLLARGARGVMTIGENSDDFEKALKSLTFGALINNKTYSLGRSGKYLTFNCAQYVSDPANAVVAFDRLQIKKATGAEDSGVIAKKGQNNNLCFTDVIGCKTAKETLREFCAMLNDPRGMAAKGKTMPKGVLLYGPPGTGKTLLAKAMANECDATFFPVSATSFFGSYVGQTEGNIRDLFRKARRYAPSIIFIDEVDAIARTRTGSIGSTHNEDALTTFLAEMDGFVTDPKRPVFILAATNYDLDGSGPRVLDAAFVRRFDRKLFVDLPDTDDRYELLLYSLKKHGVHFGDDHEKIVRNMAVRTGGMSNADLEMMNSQYVRSLGDGQPDGALYLESVDEFRYGEIKKMDPAHIRQTACHEAGHALVCRLCGITPSFLTIVSRGNFGGFMESATENERGTQTFDDLMNVVCRCLAGRIAEVEVYGVSAGINTGASSDIAKARYIIRAALEDYAMGESLFTKWKASEAEALMQKQYDRTAEMIHTHREILDRLTGLLTEKKSLDRTQLEAFFTECSV